MFSGIVQGLVEVKRIQHKVKGLSLTIKVPKEWLLNINQGASIAVNGTCLTVVDIEEDAVSFDLIQETLDCTNFKTLREGEKVNFERSIRVGDEIGGHLLSGHILGTATIFNIQKFQNNHVVQFSCPENWMKYILKKGFIAVDGASLTIVDVYPKGGFTVHLIPETLRLTTLGFKVAGDYVNIEIDSKTQAIVDSVERILTYKSQYTVA